ncbi:amino acid ABC transporter permease [Ancylobacter dichloromethanicus]|uniref:Amino acid ABC transporter membrane protein 2, PAAT family (TC 3.A.1.3.-) n=2 Tax=Ancylobacter TaxID=99 RepID=A0A1G4UTF9_9HYPH|nr:MULTISPECIES: amino acid ABC transporter permease [Ancylobacter]MBS7552860.1 amino acid ABC transporter permease [Ancylobacter dichloromethanicus]RTM01108.1 amino acid ABC transporter permease [Ancylobacter aquaticus]GLK73227.1 amino acid ABC transporter permease [Ancylobacter dichloromethanicus]SCW96912.1 amino acid ABC transporter membrane protein 2, PAAT family (TC 3.A.1.3.-) [Ancylobacter rudongensis]
MNDFTTWDVFRNLLAAVPWTIYLSLIAFAGGAAVSLLLLSLRFAFPRVAGTPVRLYVQLFQGTPLLMQLFLVYFGLALMGVQTTPLFAASLCLSVYSSAYLTETWYGCVLAVPKGQWEASSSLGLKHWQQMLLIVLPQALRLSVPPTVGLMVQIVKNTSLASIVGFVELTRASQIIANATFEPFLAYGAVAFIYFVICFSISLCGRHLEKRIRI